MSLDDVLDKFHERQVIAQAELNKQKCGCLDKVNMKLEKDGTNTMVNYTFALDGKAPERVMLSVQKIVSGRRTEGPKKMVASYCPFCGKKYPEKKQ